MKAEKHIIPAFGDEKCCSLKSKSVYGFIENKIKGGLSVRYISDILVLMKSAFKYAAREYNIKNVLDGIVMPKKSEHEVRLLTDSEQSELKKYIDNTHDETSAGIAIAMYTGMRFGEICALKWADVDFEKRIITVSSTIQRIQNNTGESRTKLVITEPKSRSSKRIIPIPECLMGLLKKNHDSAEHFVLTSADTPIEPRTMQYRFVQILKRLELPSVHFHSLRHLFATRSIALGFDVKTFSKNSLSCSYVKRRGSALLGYGME